MHNASLPLWSARSVVKGKFQRRLNFGKRSALQAKNREAVFQAQFREDLRYWVETDRKTAIRACKLIEATE